MLDKKMVVKYLETKQKIEQAARIALKWYHENIKSVEGFRFLSVTDIDEDGIQYEGDEYWNYGGHEDHNFMLPLKILYDIEYKEKLKIDTEKKRSEIKKAKEEKEIKKNKEKEEKELQEYNRLKNKYDKQEL